MTNKNSIIKFTFIFIVTIGFVRCKKFIEIGPPKDRLISNTVFASDAAATAAMIGIYNNMMDNEYGYASGSLTLYGGLSADELTDYSNDPDQKEFYTNSISVPNRINKDLWGQPYSNIYAANAILENLEKSLAVSAPVREQLTGEAKFIRAFAHFYMTNLFGNAPLILTTDYRTNSVTNNTPQTEIYKQIIDDLQEAQHLLPDNFSFSEGERVRPTKWAAKALLARVYLYIGEWEAAEKEATDIISSNLFTLTNDLNAVFLKNSNEAIWQLMPINSNANTNEGRYFILTAHPNTSVPGVTLSGTMLAAFENGDMRRQHWIDSISVDGDKFFYPFKYKVRLGNTLSEYYTVLRLAEQYLIRAEARIEQDNIAGGIEDLNALRTRARGPNVGDLPPLSEVGLTQENALLFAEQERRIELFAEWGHRWFDLKRKERADIVLGPLKSPGWQSTDQLYPIPQIQIEKDPNIIQNPGY